MGLMNIKKQCKRCQDVFTESGSINPYKKNLGLWKNYRRNQRLWQKKDQESKS